MSEATVDESQDVKAGFAGLMSKAAEQASEQAGEAPYGYTTGLDGQSRPKRAAGRPRKSPTLDELKEQKAAEGDGAPKAEDRAPDSKRRITRSKGTAEPKKAQPVPQFREGQIERGINGLYRKAGRMVRVADKDIGQALIDITRKDDPEDVTVGEAWEQLARTNPRIRAFLLRMIAGGAVGQLFMCHAPVFMAIVMKDAIRKHLPFPKLAEAFLIPDEDGEAPADGTVAEGLTMPDMAQMMAMAQQFAEQAMNGGRAPGGSPRPPGPDVASGAAVPPLRGPAAMAAGPAASGS